MSQIEEYDEVSPSASAMVEALRAYGYSPGAAVADLIDNSISAGASRVFIDCHWNGPDSHILILDDGVGMSEESLRAAMRLGSRNPLEARSRSDLGRFGMGLKTASFSQCRCLTVASKPVGGTVCLRRWDLDFLSSNNSDRWLLLKSPSSGSETLLSALDSQASGTLVLLERVDRLVKGTDATNVNHRDLFYKVVETIRAHLGMVFHRYLQGRSPPLQIHLNRTDKHGRVVPWDPFLEDHMATQQLAAEDITSASGKFGFRGYVLPHKDKLSGDEFERGGGAQGWISQQGFYVYRNERLLVPGGWLGLGRPRRWTSQPQYSLARIRVDLPNWMDQEWQIDVKKSTAYVPRESRDRVTQLAGLVRESARQVFAHRGQYGAHKKRDQIKRVWLARDMDDGRRTYRISRRHPSVRALLDGHLSGKDALESLLRVIEETVPVQQIWLDTSENEGIHAAPFEAVSDALVRKLMTDVYQLYLRRGMGAEQARRAVLQHEEFQDQMAVIATLGE